MDATRLDTGNIIEGRYRIKGTLGRGGFGAVYEAEHTGTGQMIAIKVMLADLSEHNVQAVRRFYKEAQVTAQLRHPNTVRVFDVGQTSEGALYIAMERLHGPTLEEALREVGSQGTAMTERQALDVAIPILRSLAEAHMMDLVHRDLKPANIMLTEVADEEAVVKVLDFGIARTRDSSLTGQGTALGTPAYMSPEQCMGGKVDGRSDLYSLGVILYRCVTGRTPFDDPNPLTVMYKHAHAPPPDPRQVAKSQLSEGFVVCVLKALAKKADDRFVTARAMRLCLEAVRDGQWEHGLERRDLSARDRSVVARRRAAQGAAAAAPGLTRPYGGAVDPGDAETQALDVQAAIIRAETDAYGAVDAATDPDPAAGFRPIAPQLTPALAPEGVAIAAITNRSGETAEVALETGPRKAVEDLVDASAALSAPLARGSRRWLAPGLVALAAAAAWFAMAGPGEGADERHGGHPPAEPPAVTPAQLPGAAPAAPAAAVHVAPQGSADDAGTPSAADVSETAPDADLAPSGPDAGPAPSGPDAGPAPSGPITEPKSVQTPPPRSRARPPRAAAPRTPRRVRVKPKPPEAAPVKAARPPKQEQPIPLD